MKVALLLATAVAAQASDAATADSFRSWMTTHNKNYREFGEFNVRLANYKANLRDIEYYNSIHRGMPNGARFGPNHLADRSKAELQQLMGFRTPSQDLLNAMGPRHGPAPGAVAAPSFDWRAVPGIIAPIQDQGQCGSCWAFSAVTNTESMVALTLNKTFAKLSEQQLVDCDHVCGQYRDFDGCDSGCNGGLQPNAFTYMVQNEMKSLDDYPYTAADGTCNANGRASGLITGFNMLTQDETELTTIVSTQGPVAVAVDASAWSFYMGGIMTYLCFGTTTFSNLNHAVNIVGYGTDANVDYWLIRNSWSTAWGEKGYAKILRNKGFCGVQLFANTVTVKSPSA